jgi:hypothetical protein
MLWSKDLAPPAAAITVAVHNDAGIPTNTVWEAERAASRIFQRAGIEVAWVNCQAHAKEPEDPSCRQVSYPERLQLRLMGRPVDLKQTTFGISYLDDEGDGCYAEVFYGKVADLYQDSPVNPAGFLGPVVAHEVGHLLLGTNSHAGWGLMRAHWGEEEIASAGRGSLLFSAAEAERMRRKLAAALVRNGRAQIAEQTTR